MTRRKLKGRLVIETQTGEYAEKREGTIPHGDTGETSHAGANCFVLLEILLGPATRMNQSERCRSYGRVS